MGSIPKAREKYPDWYSPEIPLSNAKYYESKRALGILFRDIELPSIDFTGLQESNFDNDDARRTNMENGVVTAMRGLKMHNQQPRIYLQLRQEVFKRLQNVYENDEDYRHMSDLFREYTSRLRPICQKYTLTRSRWGELTEEEALVGSIILRTSQYQRRNDLMTGLREKTDLLVVDVKKYIAGEEGTTSERKLRRAWTAWELALKKRQEKLYGSKSFWWICLNSIFDHINAIDQKSRGGRRT